MRIISLQRHGLEEADLIVQRNRQPDTRGDNCRANSDPFPLSIHAYVRILTEKRIFRSRNKCFRQYTIKINAYMKCGSEG